MMQKKIGRNHIGRHAALQKFRHIFGEDLQMPVSLAQLPGGRRLDDILLVNEDVFDIAPVELAREAQHESPVAAAEFDDPPWRAREIAPEYAAHDLSLKHDAVDAHEIAPRLDRLRIVGRQDVQQFRLELALHIASTRSRLSGRAAPTCSNNMVSATTPGPKAMAQPRSPAFADFNICSSTNITVAEDILPKRRRISRDAERAAGSSATACSTASRMERPPGCTAHRRISSGGVPSRISSMLRGRALRSVTGTLPESTMSKPESPIFQVIISALSGIDAA